MASSPLDTDTTATAGQAMVKDGVISSLLGLLGMTARLLLSTTPVSLGWVIRRILAASITACFVGYAVEQYIASVPLRMAVVGCFGYVSPEALDYLMRYLKARGEQEVTKYEKKPKQPKGKRKRK